MATKKAAPAKKSAASRGEERRSTSKRRTQGEESTARKRRPSARKKAPSAEREEPEPSAEQEEQEPSAEQEEQEPSAEQEEQEPSAEREEQEPSAGQDGRGPGEIAKRAAQQLLELTGRAAEGVTALERAEQGWHVEIEVIETRRIPDTTDILAVYDVEVDSDGSLIGYNRRRRYVRGREDEEAQ